MTKDEQDELVRLRAENATLKTQAVAKLSCKISDKGVISVYGLGRFPVSLYPDQWVKLMLAKGMILGFVEQNADDARIVAARELHAAPAPAGANGHDAA